MRRLPRLPKGVSARDANAATLAGSTYTGCRRDGISQGRLPTASAARTRAAPRGFPVRIGRWEGLVRTVRPGLAVRVEAGMATRAVMVRAAKPPITAGRRARDRRAAPRRGR